MIKYHNEKQDEKREEMIKYHNEKHDKKNEKR
jgi:hypothetical protein